MCISAVVEVPKQGGAIGYHHCKSLAPVGDAFLGICLSAASKLLVRRGLLGMPLPVAIEMMFFDCACSQRCWTIDSARAPKLSPQKIDKLPARHRHQAVPLSVVPDHMIRCEILRYTLKDRYFATEITSLRKLHVFFQAYPSLPATLILSVNSGFTRGLCSSATVLMHAAAGSPDPVKLPSQYSLPGNEFPSHA
jgi:hypothetical protein